MTLKLKIVLIMLVSLVVMDTALGAVYESAKGYRIKGPQGWEKILNFQGTDVAFFNINGENVNVVSKKVRKNTNAEIERAATIAGMKRNFDTYRVLSQGRINLDGVKATTLSYTFEMGYPSQVLRGYQVCSVRKGFVYFITCTAPTTTYKRNQFAFNTALKSYRWTK